MVATGSDSFALCLALSRQTLLQISLDPFRPNSDPARSSHPSIPLQTKRRKPWIIRGCQPCEEEN